MSSEHICRNTRHNANDGKEDVYNKAKSNNNKNNINDINNP